MRLFIVLVGVACAGKFHTKNVGKIQPVLKKVFLKIVIFASFSLVWIS